MLRRHAQFFDTDGDGKISIANCYTALRSLRLNPFISAIGAVSLPLAIGLKSGGNLFHISVEGVDRLMHFPNDTGGFHSETSRALVLRQSLYTLDDIKILIETRGGRSDSLAFKAEWGTLFTILNKFRQCKTTGGTDAIRREEMESLFDGSLFFTLAGRPIPPL